MGARAGPGWDEAEHAWLGPGAGEGPELSEVGQMLTVQRRHGGGGARGSRGHLSGARGSGLRSVLFLGRGRSLHCRGRGFERRAGPVLEEKRVSHCWPWGTAEATELAQAGALSWGPGFTSQDLPSGPFVPASKSVAAFCGQGLEVAHELVCFHGNWPLVGPGMGQGFGS